MTLRRHHNIAFRVEIWDERRKPWPRIRRRHRVYFEEKVLLPDKEIKMTPVTVNVGHTVTCSIVYLDQNGNPLLVTPTPDAAPTWAQTTPATESMAVTADGSTDVLTALAAGADTVSVDLKVGGVDFSASVNVNVAAAPQILTSIAVATTVS